MSEQAISRQLLTNVAIIRPILIVLLVFYHAFAIYSEAWKPIAGYPDIPMYCWLDKLSFAFMLETFVFVSGYVFGYQVRIKGESKLEAKALFWGKFKRLIIPSMVFSLLYIIIFKDITQPVTKTLYEVIGGYAHMWFLPMLFWCFAGTWVIEKKHLKPRLIFPVLVVCSLLSFVPLPLQMTRTLYYIFFFYAGYYIQRNDAKIDKLFKSKFVALSIVAFLLVFPSLTIFKEKIGEILIARDGLLCGSQMSETFIIGALCNLAKITYSTIGLVMLFVLIGYSEKKQSRPLPQWLIKIGGLCMGVYLLQQFILKALYLYTSLPVILGPYCLPWVGFAITLIVSMGLSYILRLTKTGRFLLG